MVEKIKKINEMRFSEVDNGFTVTVDYDPLLGNTNAWQGTRTARLVAFSLEEVHGIINEWFAKVQK